MVIRDNVISILGALQVDPAWSVGFENSVGTKGSLNRSIEKQIWWWPQIYTFMRIENSSIVRSKKRCRNFRFILNSIAVCIFVFSLLYFIFSLRSLFTLRNFILTWSFFFSLSLLSTNTIDASDVCACIWKNAMVYSDGLSKTLIHCLKMQTMFISSQHTHNSIKTTETQ